MALLDKGISVYNPTTGETQTINLYTTQEEVGTPYKEFAYNGEVVYVAITQDKDAAYATDFKFDNADGTWYVCTQPGGGGIDPTNGTLAISGNLDLSEDFKVDGNVTVSGNVTGTGTLSATGTITVSGSTEATVKAGATLDECDISIDNGTTTFNSDTTVADGKVSVGGTGVTNAADCVVYCDMEIESSRHGITNNSDHTCTIAGTVTITCTSQSRYGINNLGIFIISGETTIICTNDNSFGIYNTSGTFTVSGKVTITANGSSSYGLGNRSSSSFIVTDGATIDITANSRGIENNNSDFIIYEGATVSSTANSYCIENYRATFTVLGTVIMINTNSRGYGLYNDSSSSIFTVNGTVTITTDGTGVSNSGTITGTGTITVNGSPYSF